MLGATHNSVWLAGGPQDSRSPLGMAHAARDTLKHIMSGMGVHAHVCRSLTLSMCTPALSTIIGVFVCISLARSFSPHLWPVDRACRMVSALCSYVLTCPSSRVYVLAGGRSEERLMSLRLTFLLRLLLSQLCQCCSRADTLARMRSCESCRMQCATFPSLLLDVCPLHCIVLARSQAYGGACLLSTFCLHPYESPCLPLPSVPTPRCLSVSLSLMCFIQPVLIVWPHVV